MALWEVQLILIDDIALQSLDVTETADFYELVRARHHQASTVTTSNREPAEWLTVMSDPLLPNPPSDQFTIHRARTRYLSRRLQEPTRAG